MPNCRSSLIDIKVVYCKDGEPEEAWVDLSRVHALSWCSEEVGRKNAGQGGNSKLPTDPNGPGPCPQTGIADEAICWWNGTQWVCGEEP